MNGVKWALALYPLKVISAEEIGFATMWRRYNNNGCHVFVCTSVIISNNQQSEHTDLQYLEDKVFLFCSPWFLQAVCELLQEHMHSCLPQD